MIKLYCYKKHFNRNNVDILFNASYPSHYTYINGYNMKIFIALILLAISPFTYADTIELNNGKTFDGTFSGRDGDNITFEVDGISMSFQAKDVKNISMGNTNKGTDKAPQKTSTSGPTEITAGSTLTVRLSDTLNSGSHATGHKFAGVLEGSLSNNGVTVASAGSKVYGVVSEAVKARRLAGSAKLMITITDININGKITPVSVSAINALTESTAKSTISKVGKGAAIGALANGSDGAKDGAAIGLGIAILKGGNQVVVPAGTLLDFKLTKSLKLDK